MPDRSGLRDRCVHHRCSHARRTDLLPNYLSQRLIDPVLPARSAFLKVIKNVPVNSQGDKLPGIRDSAGFVVAALNAASAASREVVVRRVLSAGILRPRARTSLFKRKLGGQSGCRLC
jgi:hypothetical protein